MGDSLHLGHDGMTDAFNARLNRMLDERELVKLRFVEVTGAMRKELATMVCAVSGAECIQIVGRTMLLYRANPSLDAEKRALPMAVVTDESADEPSV